MTNSPKKHRPPSDLAKQSYPVPYLREVSIGSNRLPVAVANAGLTLVLPVFNNPAYNRVLFDLRDKDGGPLGIPVRGPSILPDIETVARLNAEDIEPKFTVGLFMKIVTHLWLIEPPGWVYAEESIIYEIVP